MQQFARVFRSTRTRRCRHLFFVTVLLPITAHPLNPPVAVRSFTASVLSLAPIQLIRSEWATKAFDHFNMSFTTEQSVVPYFGSENNGRNQSGTTGCSISLREIGGRMTALIEIPQTVLSYPLPATHALSSELLAKSEIQQSRADAKKSDMLIMILSAMYAKLVVVMGIAFPLAEVISPLIQPAFQKAYHLFLFLVSIVFLIHAYGFLVRGRQPRFVRFFLQLRQCKADSTVSKQTLDNLEQQLPNPSLHHARNCGSFYLRVGAVAFGIGSMIYTGLEIVQFFEVDPKSSCYSILDSINPLSHMAFTFIQLYFIFQNSKMCISRYQKIARFGLMHLVATNLSVWLMAVIQESKYEILAFNEHFQHSNNTSPLLAPTIGPPQESKPTATHPELDSMMPVINPVGNCRRANIIGQLLQKASPFLFPCTIEYSLICAAICYIMWKNIGVRSRRQSSMSGLQRQHHHYRVDCSNAIKGLFIGILVLVFAIISVIVFFVLVNRSEFQEIALMEAHISELVLFTMTTVAPLVAMYRIRDFRYARHRNVELDNILLIVAQTGVYLFSIFSIISGYFKPSAITTAVLLSALARLIQATIQTIFILDASQRNACNAKQAQKKPGREIITFLLVCNFAMWIINTLKTGRTESSPVQLDFYGFWGWTIVSRVSTPLAIFFRFHSTVCLCEIWKKLYKLKPVLI